MKKILTLLFLIISGTVAAEPAQPIYTLGQAGHYLEVISGKTLRPYATRDFGREKYTGARSVIVQEYQAEVLLAKLRKAISPGLVAFVGTTYSLATPKPNGVELVVGEGDSQYAILRIAASDAVNFDKNTEDLIAKLQQWDASYGIDIWQAETDTIQLRFKELPLNLREFTKEVYEFCPDIVEQGVGSISALEHEIKKSKTLYLWWD